MTNLEKMEANEKKEQLIQALNNTCQVCFDRFPRERLQLAHKIEASKSNIKLFGAKVMYHDLIMLLTCDKCNSSVLQGRKSQPVLAQELLITIIYNLYCEGEEITEAFINLGKLITENETYINLYKEIESGILTNG